MSDQQEILTYEIRAIREQLETAPRYLKRELKRELADLMERRDRCDDLDMDEVHTFQNREYERDVIGGIERY